MAPRTKKQITEREGEIVLTAKNLGRLGVTDIQSLAKKLNVDFDQKDNKGQLIKALEKKIVKKEDIEEAWIDLLENDPEMKTKTIKEERVVSIEATIPGTKTKVNLAPDEKIIDFAVLKDQKKIIYIVQGTRNVDKREVAI